MNLDERARRAAASVRQQAEDVDTDAILDRVRGDRGRRHWVVPAAATAAVAAAVIVVVTVVLPQLRTDPIEIGPDPVVPGDPEPSPSETETSRGAPTVGTWQQVTSETFVGSGDDRMRAVAHHGGTTVAVGRSADGPGIWWREQEGWEQVGADLCGEASCELNDVAVSGGRFVVAGMLDGLPKLWWSDDGHAWNRVDLERSSPGPAGETTLTAVALGPDGAVALGTEADGGGSRPVVFTSSDGRSWTEGSTSFDQDEAGADVVDAVDLGDGRFLAVGYVGDGTVLWEEQDGAWTARHLGGADPEFDLVTTFANALHQGPDGDLLLAGSAHGGQDQDGRVWRSVDAGATWSVMPGDLGGPGDQQVTDVFAAGGSLVAVGWTREEAQSADRRPAAWVLADDGWQAMDGGPAFDEVGHIAAAVETDGSSAIAVGTAGGGGDPNAGAAPADAAVWTYVAEGPGGSDGTAAAGECSAAGAPDQPAPQPALSDPVADVRQAIHDAASSCDLDTLEGLAQDGERSFTYSFGDDGDPAGYWRRLEEEGAEPLRILTQVLDLPHATVETQFVADDHETVYVWPSAFADGATDADWQAVVDSGLVTEEDADRMRVGEGYTGYRVGITAGGEWIFFVAGD